MSVSGDTSAIKKVSFFNSDLIISTVERRCNKLLTTHEALVLLRGFTLSKSECWKATLVNLLL